MRVQAFHSARLLSRYWSIAGSVQAIDPTRGAAEHGALLGVGGTRRNPLEGVPQPGPGDPHLVDREVALEETPVGPEQLDARRDVRTPQRGQLGRGRRLGLGAVV